MEVGAEVAGEISDPESRKALCFLTCRSVLRRWGAVSTSIASTTVEAFDLVDMTEERLASMVLEDSELTAAGRVGKRSDTALREG
jgi:hypothetical protein